MTQHPRKSPSDPSHIQISSEKNTREGDAAPAEEARESAGDFKPESKSHRLLVWLVLLSALAFFLYLLANAKPAEKTGNPLPVVMSYQSPGDHARAEIAGLMARSDEDIDPDAVFRRAEEFRADGSMADAYILYFFAARHHHGLSALRLATMSDPAYHDSYRDVLATPDLFQALKWYRTAKAAGVSEAEAPMNTLVELIHKRADEGDAQAKRLLLEVE